MFHFPPHHQRAIHSHASDHQQRWPGFPIRTPSDHSPLVDSPRLNADRHVLLRPFMPRHPPNALKHLQKQTKNKQQTTVHCHTHNQPQNSQPRMRSRCSHPLYNSQTPHQHPTPARRNLSPTRGRLGYRTQEPNSMPSMSQTPHNTHSQHLHE